MTIQKIWESSYPDVLKNYQLDPNVLTQTATRIIENSVQNYPSEPALTVVLPNGGRLRKRKI